MEPDIAPQRRVGKVLRHRRSIRGGPLQLIYAASALLLGLVAPLISVGFTVPAQRAAEMLVGISIGMLSFLRSHADACRSPARVVCVS